MSGEAIGRPMEILLVEDSLMQARLTSQALKRANFEHRLSIIFDGEEALEFLRQQGKFSRVPQPDLILLDLRLPKVDGIEVLTQINADFKLNQIPVVVMTSSEDEEDRAACRSCNVDAYITKPVNTERFLQAVRELRDCWRGELILPV